MLLNIDDAISNSEQKRFNVRQKLMQLGRKYKKLNLDTKTGIIQMEQNFLSYLNMGANAEELLWYLNEHIKGLDKVANQYPQGNTKFSHIVLGRRIVLNEIMQIFEDLD
jgi:hypothetical protein